MTVSYQYDVASSASGGFTRLLFKWKGSVYKLVYRELLWFTFAYTLLSVLYRLVLTPEQKRVFEKVVDYFNTFLGLIPLSFVLGVYVTLVVTRWWQQFLAIPWPDKLAHCIALYVTGNDERSRMMRRTLARYLNLTLILVLRSISMAVKKRFPTLQHLVEGGFMTKVELEIYQSVPSSEFNTYWIPCTWVISLINDAKKFKMISDSQGLKLLVEEFNEFRSKCGLLWSYDWVSIPLVYTQVVTLATYSFFAACVIGRQYISGVTADEKLKAIDLYVPIFTFLQFFFYMGLLKVAEALINPFGDDDEDFELNWMIDRHLKVSYLVVDTLLNRTPPLVKDAHYDELEPTLAYTKAAMMYKKKTFRGSVAAVLVPEDEQTMVLPEITEEEENSENNSELSINKHSNSIINLLNWTSSSGTRLHHSHQHSLHHGKRFFSEDARVQRSMSITSDVLAMEGGHLPPSTPLMASVEGFGGSHPSDVFAGCFLVGSDGDGRGFPEEEEGEEEEGEETAAAENGDGGANADPHPEDNSITSGIRGQSTSTLVSSAESLHSPKMVKTRAPPVVSRPVQRGDSLPEGARARVAFSKDSLARKARSIDMGRLVTSVAEPEVPPPKPKPSFVPRLRDLKRRHKKRQHSPPSPTRPHRFWRPKESLPVASSDKGKPRLPPPEGAIRASVPSKDPAAGVSLSLPSLHLGTGAPTVPSRRTDRRPSAAPLRGSDPETPPPLAPKTGAGREPERCGFVRSTNGSSSPRPGRFKPLSVTDNGEDLV